jgi:ribosome-binding protein aMBF1 (putative translation factor)
MTQDPAKPSRRRRAGFASSLLTKEPPPSDDGSAGVKTRLLWARMRQGKALREMSEESGISPPMLSRLERGEATITVQAAEVLAKLLNVRRAWLAFGEGGHEVASEAMS